MKRNGFTLIELLAVIVILGVILIIAIPSISAAILNSRKNAYVATANELVDGLRMKSLTNPEILPTTEEPTCYKPNEIKLEKGSNTKSPFGKDYTDDSQVCVSYNGTTSEYDYSVCLVDEGGNGISSNNITNMNKSDVKIGDATCDGSGGSGGSGSDDPVIGSSSDWELSNELNGTGGYTLIKFKGDMDAYNSIEVTEDYYNDDNLSIIYKEFYSIEDASEMSNRNAYTINIPNIVDGKTITELGPTLFAGIDFSNEEELLIIEVYFRIKEVTIPEGIVKINGIYDEETGIALGAFMYNFHTTNVTLPSTLKDIGALAFYTNNLTTLTLPSSLEKIDHGAFDDNRFTSIIFSGTSTDGSGNDTSSLTTLVTGNFETYNVNHIIYLPQTLTNISKNAFRCDYRESLCTFYINNTSIPETYDTAWAGNYARKYILNGSGGYICVENCP